MKDKWQQERQDRMLERTKQILLALRTKPDQTSVELGEPTAYLWKIEQAGLIRKAGRRNGKGRPANLYRLTDKGRKRVARLSA